MTVVEDLEKALEIFQGAEWASHMFGVVDEEGSLQSCCMMGAVNFSMFGNTGGFLYNTEGPYDILERYRSVCRALNESISGVRASRSNVVILEFNDEIAESKEDCIRAFQKAIQAEKEKSG